MNSIKHLDVSIYKGEGRLLTVPIIPHKYGYSIKADWFRRIEDLTDYKVIGEALLRN